MTKPFHVLVVLMSLVALLNGLNNLGVVGCVTVDAGWGCGVFVPKR